MFLFLCISKTGKPSSFLRFSKPTSQKKQTRTNLFFDDREPNSRRALVAWASEWPSWVLLRLLRIRRPLTCTGHSRRLFVLGWPGLSRASAARPFQGEHPYFSIARPARADLLVAGVAVDGHATVQFEHDALVGLYDASPWAPLGQPRRSLAQCRLFSEPRRGGLLVTWRMRSCCRGSCPRLRRCRQQGCTKNYLLNNRPSCSVRADRALARCGLPCMSPQRPQRCGWACRLMLVHVLRVHCVRAAKGAFVSVPWRRTHTTFFCCKYGSARSGPHRAVLCTLHRLSGVSQSSMLGLGRSRGAAPVVHCVILDVVSWFPGVLQQLWIDVSVRCLPADCYRESASRPWCAAGAGETEKTKRCGTAARALVYESYGRLGGEGTKLLRDLVTTAAANGRCSPHAVVQWRSQLELSAEADTFLQAQLSRVAATRAAGAPAAEAPLLQGDWRVYSAFSVDRGAPCATHM